jgi:hypothetical protein
VDLAGAFGVQSPELHIFVAAFLNLYSSKSGPSLCAQLPLKVGSFGQHL